MRGIRSIRIGTRVAVGALTSNSLGLGLGLRRSSIDTASATTSAITATATTAATAAIATSTSATTGRTLGIGCAQVGEGPPAAIAMLELAIVTTDAVARSQPGIAII